MEFNLGEFVRSMSEVARAAALIIFGGVVVKGLFGDGSDRFSLVVAFCVVVFLLLASVLISAFI